jgi:hypothetical protein
MGLDTKTLAELERIAQELRSKILTSPQHSRLERVELEDVEAWIRLRQKEARPKFQEDVSSENRRQRRMGREAL